MTLLALVLAIGLVVDDAIVVVENIYRHIEEGKKPMEAALLGAREIVYPIIAMTITLAAVFAPIGFVSGLTGALFKEFAFTLAGAVLVSGVIALTLSPMMCSRLLKVHNGGGGGRFTAFLDRMFDGLKQRYQRKLNGTLNYRPVTLLVLIGVIAATGLLYMTTQRELAPEEDQGILFTLVKTPQYANLDYLEDATQQLYKVYSTVSEKEHVFTINGMGDVHQGFAGILLKNWGERTRNHKAILRSCSRRSPASRRRSRYRSRRRLCPARWAALRCSSSSPQRATPASSPTCLPMSRSRRAKAACSSSRIPTFASRRRRSSFISTTTRRTGSASRWPISEARWRRCSAAITSICSTFTGAVIA
jgi:multidrug efflux pump subunit AcrB